MGGGGDTKIWERARREGGSSGPGGQPLPLAQQGSSSPLPSTPWEAKEAGGPGFQLQGHESAGSCPGLTPNHAIKGGPPLCHQEEVTLGMGSRVGGLGGSLWARASCFCQWSSQRSLGLLQSRCPPSAWGPAPPSAHPGPCLTSGCSGLGLAPAILHGLTPMQQLSQLPPVPRAHL